MKKDLILDRVGVLALRQLHQLVPTADPATLLDVAEWAIGLIETDARPGEVVTVPQAPASPANLAAPPAATVAPDPLPESEAAAPRPDPAHSSPPSPPPPASPAPRKPRRASNAAWTDEDDRALKEMLAKRYTQSHIAKVLGRTVPAIKTRLRNLRRDGVDMAPAGADPAPPVTAQAAPSQAEAAPSAPAANPGRDRRIEELRAHLDRMPHDERFDAATDYMIGRRLLGGSHSGPLAKEMGIPLDDLCARFRAMVPPYLRDPRGHISIHGMPLLLEALRLNAEEDAEA